MESQPASDLNGLFAAWRGHMAEHGVADEATLDELESHLRDEVDRLLGKGLPERQAFFEACIRLGHEDALATEYRKAREIPIAKQRPFEALSWRGVLAWSYLKVTLRDLRRHSGYTALNIAGLSIGLACAFFVLIWITDEISYDRFHLDANRIFQAMRTDSLPDGVSTGSAMPAPLSQALAMGLPEVERVVLTSRSPERTLFTHGANGSYEVGIHADPALFDVFTFPFVIGNPKTALQQTRSIVVSESFARRHFGPSWRTDPTVLGQRFRLSVDNDKDEFTVTGVFRDVPTNSSLQFDYILPMQEFLDRTAPWIQEWGNPSLALFLKLREDADASIVSRKISSLITKHHPESKTKLFLRPLTSVHLQAEVLDGHFAGGRIEYVRLFGLLGLFVVIIACINFMNLATAKSGQRTHEIGIRKAVGATRATLAAQQLGEALLIALVAFMVAATLVVLFLPSYNVLTGKTTTIQSLSGISITLALSVAIFAGLLSGIYPALYLSSVDTVRVLRGAMIRGPAAARFRKSLVVFQFVLSILLLIGTAVVYAQLEYLMSTDLGLSRENVIQVRLEGSAFERYGTFREELLRRPGIAGISRANFSPLAIRNRTTAPNWEGKSPGVETAFDVLNVDYDFVEVLEMEILSGRSFSKEFRRDSAAFIINELAAKAMGMNDPVGKDLELYGQRGEIVGVVKDFHTRSLYEAIGPAILRLAPSESAQAFIRTRAGRTAEALAGLKAVHEQISPGCPVEYEFLDDGYAREYRSEIILERLSGALSSVAAVVSCLGLVGLAAFTAERRRKEIGIRKVLGATAASIAHLLSREFLALVLVAFVMAVPLAYFGVSRWLRGFAYHISIGPLPFVLAGGVALALTLLAVGFHAARAALANPADTLRYE